MCADTNQGIFNSNFLQDLENPATEKSSNGKYIVITDFEPDDRIALHILAARISADRILCIGSTVMHTGRKKVL